MNSNFGFSFELPDEWELLTVAQLIAKGILEKPLDGNHGGIHPKSSDYVKYGVPFIMASDMINGRVSFDTCKHISEKQAKQLRKGFAKSGDVLLSHKATIGRTAIVQESNYDFIVLTPQVTYYRIADQNRLKNRYLKSYFDSYSFQNILSQWAGAGSTRAYLGITDQLKLPIILPPPDVQEVIAGMVGSLEDKIELNRQINQTLEEMAQAIFKSWFVDFEPVKAKIEAKANGQDPERAAMCAISGKADAELDHLSPDQLAQLRTTTALFPEELTDSELGLIPKGWEVRKIEDIIKRFPVGKKYAQKTASEKGDVPILDQGKSGIIGYHNDKPGVTASPGNPIIVFANHTCYMRLIMHDFSAIQNVLPFKGIDLGIYWVYGATYGKQEFVEYKGHWPDFAIKKIVVPDNQLDEKYGEYVGSFFKAIYQNDLQSLSLAELRDTLLPKLLSGEIDLSQVADGES